MKPVSDRRVSDLMAVGLLMRVFPPDLVDDVIAQLGRREQRKRLLTARVMTYFAMGMSLHPTGSYEEVMSLISDGLSWVAGQPEVARPPSKSAIFQARARLGPEPLEALFARFANAFGTAKTGVRLAGRRLVAIDGTRLDLQNTPTNASFFGRPQADTGDESPFPQVRLVALAECGTQVIFDAAIGTCTGSEVALAGEMTRGLLPGMLVLEDCAVCSYERWHAAICTGADLLWRVGTGLRPEHTQTLGDGSWLALIRPAMDEPGKPITVRVIEDFTRDGSNKLGSRPLFTTILDPVEGPATELSVAYLQRWQIERALDEVRAHSGGPRMVLRSKSPDLVLQEVWGLLCCHLAIRALMAGSSPIDRTLDTSLP